MLTVKNIRPCGSEYLFEAKEITAYRKLPASDQDVTENTLYVALPNGEHQKFESYGSFYVMNETGSTVAKYDTGGWSPNPQKSNGDD